MVKLFKVLARNVEFLFAGRGIGFLDKLKLKLTSRNKAMQIKLFGKPFVFGDSSSFVSTYEEIFIKQIYEFKTNTSNPLIIDCGANVGLSVLYFKQLYPQANIIAFEPDETVFTQLQANIKQTGFAQVELRKQAIWVANEELSFISAGGLSGSLMQRETESKVIKVEGYRLKELLNQPVDFLKIDIEGAEYPVLVDCADVLKNVQHLFVEYHSSINEPQKLDELLAIFSRAGFRYHIQEAYVSKQPFVHIQPMLNFDLQLNIFCYR